MHPKADEFIRDVRRAARLESRPFVVTDSQLIDPGPVAAVLERAMVWLTPKVVEGYDPAAFEAWSEDLQDELRNAVEDFRKEASKLSPDKIATDRQARSGVKAFVRLKETVRQVVLSEWIESASALTGDVERWARDFGWVTKHEPKPLHETLLGDYVLDQLYLHAEGSRYILDPVARFNPGGLGVFDLSIQPSFDLTNVYRGKDGIWYVHLGLGRRASGAVLGAVHEPLSAAALKRAVDELKSLP